MQEDGLALLVVGQHVDASTIGGYPDVALFVLYGLVGSVRTKTVFVVIVVAVVLQGESSAGSGAHLEQSVVLRTEPVVALRVLGDAVGTAYGIAVLVLGNGGAASVGTYDKQCVVLVAHE